jgi:uncharacterized protein (TIGR02246 family)
MTDQSATQLKMAQAYTAAWCSGDPAAVGSFYAEDGQIIINRGDAHAGRDAVIAMASGFCAEFPDLQLYLEAFRSTGTHAVFAWRLEGHHVETKNFVKVQGWEEWELNADNQVTSSLGWFDGADYDAQIAG